MELHGRVPAGGTAVETLRTPLDGEVSLGPVGEPRLGYRVDVTSPGGRVLLSSRHTSFRHRLDYTVCDRRSLRVAIHSTGSGGEPFRLTAQRP